MNLSKSKIFLLFCLSFIVGIFLGRFISYEIMAVAAMIFIITATVGWNNKMAWVLGLAGIILLLGAVRFKLDYAKNDIAQFYGQKVQVQGIITEEPDVRSDKTYLTLNHLVINDLPISSRLLVSSWLFPRYDYGEKLNFEAKILEPKEYPDFSYRNYLSRFGIDAVVYQPEITVIDGEFGNPVKAAILNIKKKFVESLNNLLPAPHNSFLAGLLVGAKHSIPQILTDQFIKTGTSHIVAISGFNITIIVAGLAWILQWLGVRKKIAFWFSVAAILGFVMMTGASASAIRAGIMSGLVLLALNVGRVNVTANALALTAGLMLLGSPQILAFDVGFQLSFAALLGIIYLIPVMEPYCLWLPMLIRKYFLATLAAQIFTLPILMFNFGQLSLIALLPNIIVLPLVPITMFFGFSAGLLGLISPSLAIPFSGLSWLLLSFILKVVEFFSNLSFAIVAVRISFLGLILYYLVLCLVLGLQKLKNLLDLRILKNIKI
ncbi:hypothetical protein A2803_01985 [Candidatus Woesebacteria bacterium RIFCSPHIGHO2_01_FULL_44_21]|uniref:ComEC/Rec2-related protein domain-containing protein n=1 Tax=Candidatus Woesebacteria bacterium RIFCSPHIGHO2_01_FULL_44_21 TaxID=1802503 RepID=A0A1F7YYK8_9BACT|nr:MAG: hypothetical protein A2803_01985 [Candidatus Woesebacteria bacterium RIFCSPHIGHO2_01_FULL_44_21]